MNNIFFQFKTNVCGNCTTFGLLFLLSSFCNFFCIFGALALEDPGSELKEAGIYTKLGTQVDSALTLISSEGETTTLSDLLEDGKPLVLIPVYYKCPRLCGLLLGGVAHLVKDLDLKMGEDYRMAAFSFNPIEGPELAAQKKIHYEKILIEAGKDSKGWDFFVAAESQSRALNHQLGFGILPDGEDYAHSAAIFILDKSGRISQFFTDIDFDAGDVRLALVDASQGKIGNLLDQAMLFCFKFDPNKGKYTWAVSRLMQVVGALSILFLGGIIVRLLLKEKKRLT